MGQGIKATSRAQKVKGIDYSIGTLGRIRLLVTLWFYPSEAFELHNCELWHYCCCFKSLTFCGNLLQWQEEINLRIFSFMFP